jgi:catalase (peroxidase I)
MDKLIKNSQEIVWFQYGDGTEGAWTKVTNKWGDPYGHRNKTEWTPNKKHPTLFQYTEILQMADYIPMISKQLEQLMLLYSMNKDDFHDSET